MIYGLIIANEDQANYDSPDHGVTWSYEYSEETGAQSEDDGAANTATIIAAHPSDNGANNAAWLCHNYNASGSYTGSGLSGWYLPSKNELNKMYIYAKEYNLIGRNCTGKKDNGAQCLIGGYDNYIRYWSSTEEDTSYCDFIYSWSQDFNPVIIHQNTHLKSSSHLGVRAIRAFNNSTIQQFNNLAIRVMTDEALYERITEMPRELICIITGYATADISRERLEKESSEIAKCILDAAKGWPAVERKEAEMVVKEMEALEIKRQTRAARLKAEQKELKKQEEAQRTKEAKQKGEEFLANGRKIFHTKRRKI